MALEKIAPYYKAVAGALIAALSALISGLAAGGLSWSEILTACIALIVGFGTVFTIPNIRSNYPPQPSEVPGVTESSIQQ
jgi:hypothetical protein